MIIYLNKKIYGGKTIEGMLVDPNQINSLRIPGREVESGEGYFPIFYFKAIKPDEKEVVDRKKLLLFIREPGEKVKDVLSFELNYEKTQADLEKEKP